MSFISHAQNFEDVMLWRALGSVQNGFFIDVGAWSPDLHSVTKAFSEHGWRGINIEPNPFYFSQIVEKRPRETNLRVAVGNRVGRISMSFIEDTGLSTADQEIARIHTDAGWKVRQEEVDLTTLSEIWKNNVPAGAPVHFLKIDVEGLEHAVIEGNDWTVNRPWVVVVESTLPLSQVENHRQWEPLLTNAQYIHCYSDGLNRYYVSAEHSELIQVFKFPPNVFDGFSLAEVEHEKARAKSYKYQLDLAADKLKISEAQLKIVEAQLSSARQIAVTAENRRAEAEQHEEEIQKAAKSQLAAELRAANESKHVAVAAANDRAAQAEHHYIAIQNSTIWRSTAPVRKMAGMIPQTARAHARRAAKALWWLLTPTRIPQRLKFIRDRKAMTEHRLVQQYEPTSGGVAVSRSSEYAKWILEVERWSDSCPFPAESFPAVTFLVAEIASVESLLRTVGSIQIQPHQAWEIVLCGSADLKETNSGVGQLIGSDSRIQLAITEKKEKASCLFAGLKLAKGKFIAVLDCGDILAPEALNEFAVELSRFPEAEVFYSDEDQQSSTQSREQPLFKPEWSPDLLYSFNYFGRLTFLQRALINRAGGIDASSGSAVEWDLNLRVSDLAQKVRRIPKVLCHIKLGSDRGRALSTEVAAEENRKAIEKFWAAKGFSSIARTQEDGTQHIEWLPSKFPRVSVVIPTKDKSHLLRMCLNGLRLGTDYPDIEIVVVDTGSKEPETFSYYQELAAYPEVKIVNFEKVFNYSAACNYGASCATGEVLLFLNNDIEVISRSWLKEMVGFAMRPGVGVVGTKLIYPSLELQHGGVGIGPHLCALMYRSAGGQPWGVFGTPDHPRNWLAIMGACQLVRRDVFDLIGKFDESYFIAMSDVALCLRAWRAGYRTAYAPAACLIHHEGATRGNNNPIKDMRRIADDIRAMGIDEDPYLHPGLSGNYPTPRLKLNGELNPRQVLDSQVADCGSILALNLKFDLANEGVCMQTTGLPRSAVLWTPQAVHLVSDKWSAARWCLDLLRSRRDLRVRFPKALSGGTEGAFYRWLRDEAKTQMQLPTSFNEAIESLFSEDISAGARQLFLFREDVRQAIPHGLTPAGQGELFQWFMRHGRVEGSLRLEEIWWLFWQAAERPAQELVWAYRFAPAWQCLYPDALTVFGCQDFAAWFSSTYNTADHWMDPSQWPLEMTPARHLRSSYNARHQWRALHPEAFSNEIAANALIDWLQKNEGISAEARAWCCNLNRRLVVAEMLSPGVNIIGHFCYPSGLRVSAEALVGALKCASIQTSLRDIRTDKKDDPKRLSFDGFEDFDITVIHTQPEPFFSDVYERSDLSRRAAAPYRIAYWYWEFDSIPDSWISAAAKVDEVWTATEFVAKGLRERLSIPVRTLFPGVKLGYFQSRDHEYFGLKDGDFTFLFTFHMMSIMERKNPLGLIRAFKQAFDPSESVSLVLKTSFGDRHPDQMIELRKAAEGANIKIIDQVYSSDEVLSLMNACDAYVSLHRSEGLGLTMAEAMLMGKPVIATNYSGNIDFMDESNSLLVPFELKKLGRPIPPYDANLVWAEPSTDYAANCMRRLYDDQVWAVELGARAKVSAEKSLSLDVAGQRIAERLREIRVNGIG